VAVDPGGTEVAAAWRTGEILRWELKTGKALLPFEEEEADPAEVIAYSPDGRFLASAFGHSVRLWDRATGKRVREFPQASVTDVAFARDGSWLVSGGETGAVRAWDAATGEERLGGERLPELTGLAVSADGTWAVTALFTEVRVWDTLRGTTSRRVTRGDETTSSVAIRPDGKVESVWGRAVEGDRGGWTIDHATVLWDPATGETLHMSPLEERGADLDAAIQTDPNFRRVAVSPDGTKIAGARKDGTVRVWTREGREIGVLHGHTDVVNDVTWSEDGRWIISAAEDRFVRVWDAAAYTEADLIAVDGGPEMLAFRKGRLYVGCANRTVCVYGWSPPE
jgi:WD40 repeat protein